MRKRLSRQEKYAMALKEIINEMFIISDNPYTFEDIEHRTDDWYNQITMTEKNYLEWIEWGTNYLKKKFKYNKRFAEIEMGMISMNYGLRVDSKSEERQNKLNEILKD
jgi:hypothetical protein